MERRSGKDRRSNFLDAISRTDKLMELKVWIQDKINESKSSDEDIDEDEFWEGYEQALWEVTQRINEM
jgi:hypothetical protein